MKLLMSIVLLASLASCNSQVVKPTNKGVNNEKKDTMERFNKTLFDQNKVDGHREFTLEDGTMVKQWETPHESFFERLSDPRTNYSTYKEFYYNSGNLKMIGKEFFSFPIGTWKEYTDNGSLTK